MAEQAPLPRMDLRTVGLQGIAACREALKKGEATGKRENLRRTAPKQVKK